MSRRTVAVARLLDAGGRMSLRMPAPDGEQEVAYAVDTQHPDGLWELHLGDDGWTLVTRTRAKKALVRLATTSRADTTPRLSREALESAERLVADLSQAAAVYGVAVDGQEAMRPALLATARLLLQLLVPDGGAR